MGPRNEFDSADPIVMQALQESAARLKAMNQAFRDKNPIEIGRAQRDFRVLSSGANASSVSGASDEYVKNFVRSEKTTLEKAIQRIFDEVRDSADDKVSETASSIISQITHGVLGILKDRETE